MDATFVGGGVTESIQTQQPMVPDCPAAPATIAAVSPVNASMFQDELRLATSRFEYLSAKKDQAQEKLRVGVFALNGASLVALISAVSGSGSAAKWLGFTVSTAPVSATAFAAGAVLAGASLMREADRQGIEAAHAFARQSSASTLVAMQSAPPTAENLGRLGEMMSEHHKLPQVGFGYSSVAIGLQNAACGAWITGIVIPLVTAIWP